jgi:arylsulfatase A-like enzyme
VQTEERLALWDGEQRRIDDPDPATLTGTYTREAMAFIKENAAAGRPFFLYLAHSMPHVPLAASPRWKGVTPTAYGDVMAELDDSVGQVRAALSSAGVAETTIVVFTSDNGPWNAMPDRMFGRDSVKRWDHGSPGPFRGGKAGTYEGGHRVPFLAVWPGQVAAGQVSDEPLSLVDLLPTLAARAGAADRVPADVDGRDVWPLISRGGRLGERPLLYDNLGKAEAIRVGPWKLRVTAAVNATGPSAPERVELFDLVQDPSERYDLASTHPDVVSRLRWLLEKENGWRPASVARSSIESGRIR